MRRRTIKTVGLIALAAVLLAVVILIAAILDRRNAIDAPTGGEQPGTSQSSASTPAGQAQPSVSSATPTGSAGASDPIAPSGTEGDMIEGSMGLGDNPFD